MNWIDVPILAKNEAKVGYPILHKILQLKVIREISLSRNRHFSQNEELGKKGALGQPPSDQISQFLPS